MSVAFGTSGLCTSVQEYLRSLKGFVLLALADSQPSRKLCSVSCYSQVVELIVPDPSLSLPFTSFWVTSLKNLYTPLLSPPERSRFRSFSQKKKCLWGQFSSRPKLSRKVFEGSFHSEFAFLYFFVFLFKRNSAGFDFSKQKQFEYLFWKWKLNFYVRKVN